MKNQFTYKPEILVEMAQEYLQAEEALRVFVKKHTPFPGYCNLSDRNDESEYWRLDKASSCTWDALRSACRLVDANIDAVLAMAKAMNRYEKRERWQVCAHLPTGWCSSCGDYGEYGEDRVRRFFSNGDEWTGYFRSTGRRQPWAA